MSGYGTPQGGHAAPLDAAIGLVRDVDDGDWVVLRLDPAEVAIGSTDPVTYLHGGVIATCVDTASWEAVVATSDESWVVADMRIDHRQQHASDLDRVFLHPLRFARPRREDQSHAPSDAYQFTATYLVSVYSRMPSWPPSRPMPLCFMPPNGAAGSDTRPRFTPTMPDSIASATRRPRARSRV